MTSRILSGSIEKDTILGANLLSSVLGAGSVAFKSASEDFFVDALDLDIHLDCGDAFRRTCDFEVHIAKEVFKTLDVGEHCDFVALFVLDKSHCDACDGCFDRNACVHKCERAAANGCLRSRTVGAQNVGYRADCVGELLFGRKHGSSSPSSF